MRFQSVRQSFAGPVADACLGQNGLEACEPLAASIAGKAKPIMDSYETGMDLLTRLEPICG